MNDLNIEFPLDDFEKLISQVNGVSLDEMVRGRKEKPVR